MGHNPTKSYKLLHDILAGNDYTYKTYKIRKKTVLTKKFHNILFELLGNPKDAIEYHFRLSKRVEEFINLETASKIGKEVWMNQYKHEDGKR